MSWYEDASLWQIWLAISAGLIAVYELGYRGNTLALKYGLTARKDEGIAFLVSAALALLGLLIAFTFAMATDRYDARRTLIVDEANAVGTTYLRVQLLAEPARTSLGQMMFEYIDAREEFLTAGRNRAKIDLADFHTNEAGQKFWTTLAQVVAAQPDATINSSLLESANQMFDLAAQAEAAVEASLPATIIDVLIIYALTSAALIGYAAAATRSRHYLACTIVFILFAIAISLTIDLDRPRRGTILVSVLPFERAANTIRSMEAAHASPALK
jgi:hypothetical protein